MNSEIFFNLSNQQISIIIFDKDSKKEISNKVIGHSSWVIQVVLICTSSSNISAIQ